MGILTALPRLALALLLLAAPLAGDAGSLSGAVREITRGQRFSFVGWHARQFAGLLRPVSMPPEAQRDPAGYVRGYYVLLAQARGLERAMGEVPEAFRVEIGRRRPVVERILARQIETALHDEGIHNPLDRHLRVPVTFPPVWFVLEPPPHLLVISPRDRILSVHQVMLVQEMDLAMRERIEEEVEALGYSALVTPLGGFGATYPAAVNPRSSLQHTIEIAVEEWLHQYLAFTPMGYGYVLHLVRLRPDRELAELNESFATIVHEEIGELIMVNYYGATPQDPDAPGPSSVPEDPDRFDFRAFMRETRLQTEALLAEGEIDAAEAYMEVRRQMAAEEGYVLRRLNQAYFAFHGTYADAPGAITPVGAELRALRATTGSLREFVAVGATITSRDQLLQLLEEQGVRVALVDQPTWVPQ